MNLRDLPFFELGSRKDCREMEHFSCDICQRPLDLGQDGNYEVRIEVRPAEKRENVPIDDDRDYLNEFDEILERYEEFDENGPYLGDGNYLRKKAHLCSQCGQRYLQAPLGQQLPQRYELSKPLS
jgi:hypothetical protein